MVAVHTPLARFVSQFIRIVWDVGIHPFCHSLVIVHYNALNGTVAIDVLTGYLPIASDGHIDVGRHIRCCVCRVVAA